MKVVKENHTQILVSHDLNPIMINARNNVYIMPSIGYWVEEFSVVISLFEASDSRALFPVDLFQTQYGVEL